MINYLRFTAGVTKGNVEAGYVFNDPFHLGKVDPNYTSSRVVKNFTAKSGETTDFTAQWKPLIEGTITVKVTHEGTTRTFVDTAEGKFTQVKDGDSVTRRTVMVQPVTEVSGLSEPRFEGTEAKVETVVLKASGEAETATTGATINYGTGVITFGADEDNMKVAEGDAVEIAYSY